jgi:hypothetical protein
MAKRGRRPAGVSPQRDMPKGVVWKRRVKVGELESTLLICLLAIFFLKPLYPSCRIQEFLFTREERMTVGTDLYMDFLLGTLRLKGGPTGAFNDRIKDFGVNILLHCLKPPFIFLLPISQNFSTICKITPGNSQAAMLEKLQAGS